MIIILLLLSILVLSLILFLQHPKFGKAPSGARLERMQRSPHYKNGRFENIHFTPDLTEGHSMGKVMYEFLFKKFPHTRPAVAIPAVKTDLHAFNKTDDILVWFGHSSYYLQVNGKCFLIDPVFSGNASPVPGSNKAFSGSDIYTVADMPEIDYLLITHDHYDHLDHPTILQLKQRVKQVICGLGVGEHLEYWGYDPAIITEMDWNEQLGLEPGFELFSTTARHFSGRKFKRNSTLWLSFVLKTPAFQLFLGGDSGYDTHFATIGERFGGFDLAILENGQYNPAWHAIHLFPEELLKASKELKARTVMPVHNSKFKMAFHPWDAPMNDLDEQNKRGDQQQLITPRIGEPVWLGKSGQAFTAWWKELD